MPTIFELFGYPLDDHSSEAEAIRKSRQCPFMGDTCDGGGNRYQTEIKLTPTEPLTSYFNPGVTSVVPGVCSILAGGDIWVVCPRRLFATRYSGPGLPPLNQSLQTYERDLLISSGLPQGVDIGFWSEVYLKQRIAEADINYHFDYIAAPLIPVSLRNLLQQIGLTELQLETEFNNFVNIMRKSGYYSKGERNPVDTVIQLPNIDAPFIIEVMTASTSGSDTENSTDIRGAFRNAILFSNHMSPGINKRQVWGRMVTQLFAKTALAHKWGGKTLWIIQDELLRNIELTTRLRTNAILDNSNQNINMIVMYYEMLPTAHRKMSFKSNLKGDAGLAFNGNDTFTDILLPKVAPHKIELLRAMLRRKIDAIIRL